MQTDDTLRALGFDLEHSLRPSVTLGRGRKAGSFDDDMASMGYNPKDLSTIPPAYLDSYGQKPRGIWGKDQLWLCQRAPGVGRTAVSPLHPEAAAFNRAGRRHLAAVLIHDSLQEAIHVAPAAYVLPGQEHTKPTEAQRQFGCACEPNAGPDGQLYARRWVLDADAPREAWVYEKRTDAYGQTRQVRVGPGAWRRVPCFGFGAPGVPPCPFTQGEKPSCKLSGHLIVQVSEPDLPTWAIEVKTGGSWNTSAHQWIAQREDITRQFKSLGGDGAPNLYGMPVRLEMTPHEGRGQRFEVIGLHPNFRPGQTLQSWLVAKHTATAPLRAMIPTATAMITDGAPTILPTRGST